MLNQRTSIEKTPETTTIQIVHQDIFTMNFHNLEEISPYPTQKTLKNPQLVSCDVSIPDSSIRFLCQVEGR